MTRLPDIEKREADHAAEERLELLPRSVRDKLDRVRIKLHLRDWQALPLFDRERLRDLPCETRAEIDHYAMVVERLIVEVSGVPPDRLKEEKK